MLDKNVNKIINLLTKIKIYIFKFNIKDFLY